MSPSAQRLIGAVGFSVLMVILAYFLPFPHSPWSSVVWAIPIGLVVGYFLWPSLQSAHHPPGYLQPSSARILKAMVAAAVGTAVVALLQYVVLDDGINIAGWVVAFLFIGALAYVNLGGVPRKRSHVQEAEGT